MKPGKQETTSKAIERYSVSQMNSQKTQNLGYNFLTVWMYPIYEVDPGYPKKVRSHLCLGFVKSNKYKSGISEKRCQRIRIA